ncbi:MAG TPA: hypothetical protein DDY70_05815 [Clostridiales bacterium]|nr:hypothetical protein [Clostridiales bacterium]
MASIFLRTVLIYFFLSVALKLMGKRQIGELEVGELVSTLLISEIAAIPIDDPDLPLLNAVIPILFILSAEILLSAIKNHSAKLKHLIEGDPVYIIYKGKIRQQVLEDNRISINELLSELRVLGIADISEVYYAILEQSGKLSVTLRADCQPITKQALTEEREPGIAHLIVVDREVNETNLRALGYDRVWLNRVLAQHGVRLPEVYLLTVDDLGSTSLVKKEEKNA